MPKLIFVNLPVSDLARSTAFYEAVGARKNEQFCDGTASCMVFSETIHAMLLTHDKFREFTPKAIADAKKTSEVLVCVSAESRSEVDATRQVLAKLGQPIGPHTRLGALPLGQQQIVEIARALVRDVRVLMMDEPTSALSAAEIPVLFSVIRDLASHGVSVVYISHRLEELLRIANSVTVLRDGVVVGEASTSEVDIRWLVDRMTGGQAIAPRARPAGGISRGPSCRLSRWSQIATLSNSASPSSQISTGTLPSGLAANTASLRRVGLVSWWITSIRPAKPASCAITSTLRA